MFTADMIGHLCWFSHTCGLLESLTSGHCLVFQCHGNKAVQFQSLVRFVVVTLSGLAHLIFYQNVLKQSKMSSDKPRRKIEVKWWYVVTATVTIPCFCPRHSHGNDRAKHAKNCWDWIQEYPYHPCVWWERNILSTNLSYNAFTQIGAHMKSNTIVMRKTKRNWGIHFIICFYKLTCIYFKIYKLN